MFEWKSKRITLNFYNFIFAPPLKLGDECYIIKTRGKDMEKILIAVDLEGVNKVVGYPYKGLGDGEEY